MKLIIIGTVETLSTRQDGTIKVNFGTQEMGADEAGKLFHFRGKYCKLFLSDDNITDLEANLIEAEKVTGTTKKSKGQRLRAVLYRLWEQSGLQIEFDTYYETEMEKVIELYKAKFN